MVAAGQNPGLVRGAGTPDVDPLELQSELAETIERLSGKMGALLDGDSGKLQALVQSALTGVADGRELNLTGLSELVTEKILKDLKEQGKDLTTLIKTAADEVCAQIEDGPAKEVLTTIVEDAFSEKFSDKSRDLEPALKEKIISRLENGAPEAIEALKQAAFKAYVKEIEENEAALGDSGISGLLAPALDGADGDMIVALTAIEKRLREASEPETIREHARVIRYLKKLYAIEKGETHPIAEVVSKRLLGGAVETYRQKSAGFASAKAELEESVEKKVKEIKKKTEDAASEISPLRDRIDTGKLIRLEGEWEALFGTPRADYDGVLRRGISSGLGDKREDLDPKMQRIRAVALYREVQDILKARGVELEVNLTDVLNGHHYGLTLHCPGTGDSVCFTFARDPSETSEYYGRRRLDELRGFLTGLVDDPQNTLGYMKAVAERLAGANPNFDSEPFRVVDNQVLKLRPGGGGALDAFIKSSHPSLKNAEFEEIPWQRGVNDLEFASAVLNGLWRVRGEINGNTVIVGGDNRGVREITFGGTTYKIPACFNLPEDERKALEDGIREELSRLSLGELRRRFPHLSLPPLSGIAEEAAKADIKEILGATEENLDAKIEERFAALPEIDEAELQELFPGIKPPGVDGVRDASGLSDEEIIKAGIDYILNSGQYSSEKEVRERFGDDKLLEIGGSYLSARLHSKALKTEYIKVCHVKEKRFFEAAVKESLNTRYNLIKTKEALHLLASGRTSEARGLLDLLERQADAGNPDSSFPENPEAAERKLALAKKEFFDFEREVFLRGEASQNLPADFASRDLKGKIRALNGYCAARNVRGEGGLIGIDLLNARLGNEYTITIAFPDTYDSIQIRVPVTPGDDPERRLEALSSALDKFVDSPRMGIEALLDLAGYEKGFRGVHPNVDCIDHGTEKLSAAGSDKTMAEDLQAFLLNQKHRRKKEIDTLSVEEKSVSPDDRESVIEYALDCFSGRQRTVALPPQVEVSAVAGSERITRAVGRDQDTFSELETALDRYYRGTLEVRTQNGSKIRLNLPDFRERSEVPEEAQRRFLLSLYGRLGGEPEGASGTTQELNRRVIDLLRQNQRVFFKLREDYPGTGLDSEEEVQAAYRQQRDRRRQALREAYGKETLESWPRERLLENLGKEYGELSAAERAEFRARLEIDSIISVGVAAEFRKEIVQRLTLAFASERFAVRYFDSNGTQVSDIRLTDFFQALTDPKIYPYISKGMVRENFEIDNTLTDAEALRRVLEGEGIEVREGKPFRMPLEHLPPPPVPGRGEGGPGPDSELTDDLFRVAAAGEMFKVKAGLARGSSHDEIFRVREEDESYRVSGEEPERTRPEEEQEPQRIRSISPALLAVRCERTFHHNGTDISGSRSKGVTERGVNYIRTVNDGSEYDDCTLEGCIAQRASFKNVKTANGCRLDMRFMYSDGTGWNIGDSVITGKLDISGSKGIQLGGMQQEALDYAARLREGGDPRGIFGRVWAEIFSEETATEHKVKMMTHLLALSKGKIIWDQNTKWSAGAEAFKNLIDVCGCAEDIYPGLELINSPEGQITAEDVIKNLIDAPGTFEVFFGPTKEKLELKSRYTGQKVTVYNKDGQIEIEYGPPGRRQTFTPDNNFTAELAVYDILLRGKPNMQISLNERARTASPDKEDEGIDLGAAKMKVSGPSSDALGGANSGNSESEDGQFRDAT